MPGSEFLAAGLSLGQLMLFGEDGSGAVAVHKHDVFADVTSGSKTRQ